MERKQRSTKNTVFLTIWVAATMGCAGNKVKPSSHALDLIRKGAGWLKTGDLHRAEAAFGLAREYRPKMAEAVNGLALVSMARGETRRAERLFRKALTLKDDLSEAHNNLAVLLCRRGRLRACRKHLISSLAIDPGFFQARYNLGRCLIRMGRLDGARKHLLKIVAQHPEMARAWAQLALVHILKRDLARAGRAIAAALRRNPNLSAALRAKGRLLQIRGAHKSAAVAFRKALGQTPSDWRSRHYLALSLSLMHRPAEALVELERVLARHPRNPQVLYAAGFAFCLTKNYSLAISRFRQALTWKPRFHRARYMLMLTYRNAGRTAEAAATFRKLVRGRAPISLINLARTQLRSFKSAWLDI